MIENCLNARKCARAAWQPNGRISTQPQQTQYHADEAELFATRG
ncbi:hypothetical protein ACNKHX_19010 [Shigella flexneri]